MRVLYLFLFVGVVFGKHETYDGHAIFEIDVENAVQVKILQQYEAQLNLDVWSHPLPGRPGKLLVSKDNKEALQNALADAGIKFKIEVDNVKELLDMEDRLFSQASARNSSRSSDLFNRILTYAEVDAYLERIASSYPGTVTLASAGRSFEGREMKYLKISTTNFQDTTKPVVYIQSLLHAREWVTLPATLYAIEKLVVDVTEQDVLQGIDWIVMPIANPDGYVFTHLEQRLWRKNRANNYGNFCQGVDLNRNFDFLWSTASSNLVCSDTFHGRSAFSEPETANIRDVLHEHRERLELFLDIHSFGSMILYGYGNGVLPSNGLFVHLVGIQMGEAINAVKMSWNPDYIVGNVAMVLYDASGSAMDYAMQVGAPFSYTYELPGHRFGIGGFGFFVDPDFIEQAGFETWEGIKAGARYARDNYARKMAKK